jgi:tetratricopeptide (TPR) repeat protein
VAGGSPELPVVLAAAGLDRHEGYAVAAEALTSGLLVDAAGPDRVQFRHELVRDAVLAGLRSPERRHRHVGLARATAGRVAAGEAARAELVSAARHYLDGFPACPASEVEEAAVAAAQAAVDLLALEDAAEFAVRALGLRPSGPDPVCAAELLLVAGIAAGQLARHDEARTLLDRALEVARGLGDAHLIARVALGGEPPARPLLDYLARLPRLQVSLDALEGHQCLDRVRVGTALVREGSVPGRYHDRRGLAEEAVAQARVLGDPRTLYGALTGWLEQHQGLPVTGRLAMADELVDLAPRTGDAALAVRARLTRAHERLRSGDGRGMEADVEQLRAAVRGTRRVRDRWMLAVVETTLSRLHGDLAAAARHAGEALGHVTGVGELDAGLCHAVHQFFEAFHLGRLAGLVKLATETHRAGPDLPSLSLAAALAGAEAGQPVRPHVIDSALDGSAADELWPATVALATMLAEATGDIRRLPDLRGALEPLTGTIIVTGALSGCFGPADRYLAMVSRRSGDHEAARGHAERAVRLAEAAGTVVWTLWSRVELAAATVDADPRSAVRTAAAIEAEARRLVLPGPARAAARLCIRAGKQVG